MTIVMNELEWAEEMIASCSLGKRPFETLCRVAKYYLSKNYSKQDVRRMMDMFLLRCEPSASLPKWSDMMDYALVQAQKYKPIQLDHISISVPEMERIEKLGSVQTKRLAFTLLCLAKYYDTITESRDHWVSCRDSEIMKLASINTSLKRQSAMYHTLNELGMVRFSKRVDNTNVCVTFIEDGDTAMEISDFRNIGNQYMLYIGDDNYFRCKTCGVVVRRRRPNVDGVRSVGRPQVNCTNCSISIRTQTAINNTMRIENVRKSRTVREQTDA